MAVFASFLVGGVAFGQERPDAARLHAESGSMFYRDGQYEMARVAFTSACDRGHPDACYILGGMYADGMGGPIDRAQGRELARRACMLQHARSCTYLAAMMVTESGFAPSMEAQDFYRRGCDGGDGEGCYALGAALAMGADMTQARTAFETGCSLSNGASCHERGRMLRDGLGGAADQVSARRAFAAGCELSHAESCFDAGAMFREGDGGSVNTRMAENLFSRGCELGDWRSCERR